jgi:membrane protein required for colicin V production
LSIIDIVLSVLLIIGAFGGYRKGFLAELFSLLGIVLGVLAGFKLMGSAMLMLDEHYQINEKVLPYVAFAVVFLAVIIIVSLLGKFLSRSLDKTVLGNADQVLGGVLGLLRTAFMLSVIIWITSSLKVELPEHWFEDDWLYPTIAKFAPAVTEWVGEIFPSMSDLFSNSD